MKKYFIFAAIAAAGLFASCSSSDDVVANEGNQIEGDGPVAIKIGVNKQVGVGVDTRGTGTVGGVADGTNAAAGVDNVWAGQKINVYMFKKGTLDLATEKVADQDVALYDGAEMITPGSAANKIPNMDNPTDFGEAMITDGTIKYWPLNISCDFFGYRADGAFSAAGAVAPVKNQAGDAYIGTFVIDGTQDLMATKAAPTNADQSKTGYDANKIYSAAMARKDIHPNLTFDHLLTRLAFTVKAGNLAAAGATSITGYVNSNNNNDTKTVAEYEALTFQDQYEVYDYVNNTDNTDIILKATYDALDPNDQANYAANSYTKDGGTTTITAAAWGVLAATDPYVPVYGAVDPTDANYTGVKIKSIEILSKKTGDMYVAWTTAPASKIVWPTTTGNDLTDAKCDFLALKQRNAIAANLLGYIKNDKSEIIAATAYDAMTAAEKANYKPYYDPSKDLVDLVPVPLGFDNTATGDDRFIKTDVGEALLVSLPVSATIDETVTPQFSDVADGTKYWAKVTIEQKVRTNWNNNTLEAKSSSLFVEIPAPTNSPFAAGSSYTVNFTIYGFERIVVNTTLLPWTYGGSVDVVGE